MRTIFRLSLFIFFPAVLFLPAYSQMGVPVDDPYSRCSDAQLIEYIKADPQTTAEYETFNGALSELRHRGPSAPLISKLMALFQQEDETRAQNEAVKLLVSYGAREVTPILITWLGFPSHDSSLSYRRTLAYESLGKLLDPASKPALVEYFRGGTGYRENIMVILARMGAVELLPEFKPYLKDRLTFNQAFAAQAMAILGDKSGRNTVRELLKDKKYPPPQEELDALAEFGDQGDLGLLEDLSRKFANKPRVTAGIQLARFKIQLKNLSTSQKIPKLTALLADPHFNGDGVEWALETLAACGEKESIAELEKIAIGEGNPYVRDGACRQLWRKGIHLGYQKMDKFGYRYFLPKETTNETKGK